MASTTSGGEMRLWSALLAVVCMSCSGGGDEVSSDAASSAGDDTGSSMGEGGNSSTETGTSGSSSSEETTGTDGSDSVDSSTTDATCPEVHDGDLTLNELDVESVRCLREVTGSLTVEAVDGLVDLEAFAALERVGFRFAIYANPHLRALDGLERLEFVGTTLNVQSNPMLTDMTALGSIADFGTFIVADNPILTDVTSLRGEILGVAPHGSTRSFIIRSSAGLLDLDGLLGVSSFEGSISITNNPNLQSVGGLRNMLSGEFDKNLGISGNASLERIDSLDGLTNAYSVSIHSNPLLADLSGLSNLRSTEFLYLLDLPQLQSLEGLDSLEEVTDYFEFGGCLDVATPVGSPWVTSLAGLGSLEYVRDMRIVGNTGLTSLSGAENLLDVDWLMVALNAALPAAEVSAFASRFMPTDTLLCGNLGDEPCPPCNEQPRHRVEMMNGALR